MGANKLISIILSVINSLCFTFLGQNSFSMWIMVNFLI